MIKLIECPRDAMQGIKEFIPTEKKIEYINVLLDIGFDTIDFGSFVSPKAIPQMRDTGDVLKGLNLSEDSTDLLAIVANFRGARDACQFDEIRYLGYPFSISETFQLRNTNSTIEESYERLKKITEHTLSNDKEMVVYISMGFGNPYGDPWNFETVQKWVEKIQELGVNVFALSDTIGVANQENISYIFSNLIETYPTIEFGAHFHTKPDTWEEKVEAAYENGCRRFDSAIRGYGGCPMAKDDLTGNMPTENLVYYFDRENAQLSLDRNSFRKAMEKALEIFP